MDPFAEKLSLKDENRALRKQIKRLEKSRSSIKTKNREKGKIIKIHQDRRDELRDNRDLWKTKYKEHDKEYVELENKFQEVAALLQIKEEQLLEMLSEFEEVKKK